MLHANITNFERRMVGIKDKSANLQAVVEPHRLKNTPYLKSAHDPLCKKKK